MTEEEVDIKIKERYDYFMSKPMEVYEIFCNFFGEEFVDLQGFSDFEDFKLRIKDNISIAQIMSDNVNICNSLFNVFILVRFPEVRITNENNRYIDIWELYAQVFINRDGTIKGTFGLNRSKYNKFQFSNKYIHSHVTRLDVNRLSMFHNPCLGEGPIRDTITLLTAEFDALRWELFCLELSKYVTVESLDGGPYIKLEGLGKNSLTRYSNTWSSDYIAYKNINNSLIFSRNQIKDFIEYVIRRNQFKFNYIGSYGIATSYINWVVFLSNEFISWLNERIESGFINTSYSELISKKILYKGIIKDDCFFVVLDNNITPSNYVGGKICTFKGKDVLLEIIPDDNREEVNYSHFIDFNLAEIVYKSIVQVINFEYGNKRKEEFIRDDKKVFYI